MHQPALIPLAGPANRQGRIAADVIMGTEPSRFRGTQVGLCPLLFRCSVAGAITCHRRLMAANKPAPRPCAAPYASLSKRQPSAPLMPSQGTAVVGLFGMTAASTGASERTLKRVGTPYEKARSALGG